MDGTHDIRGTMRSRYRVAVLLGALLVSVVVLLGTLQGPREAEAHNQAEYGFFCGTTSDPPLFTYLGDWWSGPWWHSGHEYYLNFHKWYVAFPPPGEQLFACGHVDS